MIKRHESTFVGPRPAYVPPVLRASALPPQAVTTAAESSTTETAKGRAPFIFGRDTSIRDVFTPSQTFAHHDREEQSERFLCGLELLPV